MGKMRVYEVIIKTVLGCNLACKYCYVDHGRGTRAQKLVPIDTQILERFMPQFMSHVSRQGCFDWHGGEPTLAGVEFFEEAMRIQSASTPEGKSAHNIIQTNATLVDDKWIDFLKRHNFRVGVSIDGPPELHDRFRINHAGKPSSKEVIAGIKKLREAEIHFGAIVVITSETIGHEEALFHFLVENGIDNFDLSPCMVFDRYTGQPIYPTIFPDDYGRFLIKMYDLWLKHGDPGIKIRRFDAIHAWMMGRAHGFCQFAAKCTGYIALDYNGNVSPCDELIGFDELVFGNILHDDLETILASPNSLSFISEVNNRRNLHPDCVTCKWLAVCKGGCPATIYRRTQGFGGKEFTCESRKMLFEHVSSVIRYYEDREWASQFRWDLLNP